MPEIKIYSLDHCPYCTHAKNLLDRKGASYEEINLSDLEGGREKLMEIANGKRTVPQIFIGDTHVGGFDDLNALDQAGGLDPLLQG